MPHPRLHPRIVATGDLLATLRPAGRSVQFAGRVLNLSAGGMLIAGRGFEVAESIGVELAGPDFRLAGQGQVVHCTSQTVGVRIVSWEGQAHRPIGAMIAARSRVAPGLAAVARLTSHTPNPSGTPAAAVGDEPLGAPSALIVKHSDDDGERATTAVQSAEYQALRPQWAQAEAIAARLAAIVESSDDAVISMALAGTIESWNRGAERIYGYAAPDTVGRHISFLVPAGHEDEIPAILDRVRRGERIAHYETVHRHKDGIAIDVSITVSPVLNSSGTVIGASVIAHDVTDRSRADAAVREAQELFHRVFDEAPIGMAMLDLEHRFVGVNDALCEITGYPREQLEATNIKAITHPDDLGTSEQEIAALLAGGASGCRSEKRFVHTGRSPVWVAVHTTVLRDADARPSRFIAQIQDITDRRRSDERLVYLTDHDPLTGLLNRRSFERELEAHRSRRARYGGEGAAIMLDLDHFKFINDTLGHHAGDEAIIRTARVLASRLRETDVLARLGGDEFAVLLPDADAAKARRVAEDLLAALRAEVVELGRHARPLAASAGIALFEAADGPSGDEVLVNADLAMYDAKNAGRDRAELFASSEQCSSRMKGRVTWAQRIGAALQHDGFMLVTQPIVELATGHTSQHELLLRMRDEHGDQIPPASFLYIAERLGMVQEIDRWVTTQAITLLAEHHDQGQELTLEVNLSGLSIGDPELLALISRELDRTGVAPRNLIFEITETAAVINMTQAGQFIRDLTQLGCRFALDDFGAGYGSFSYLKHLPFDFLKIDGEFVKHATTSQTDRLLIKAGVDIATGMGKRTIAEFVGDEETVRLLTNLGVDYGQGFHLGHPAALNGTHITTSINDTKTPDEGGAREPPIPVLTVT